jgi:hypothetical protein
VAVTLSVKRQVACRRSFWGFLPNVADVNALPSRLVLRKYAMHKVFAGYTDFICGAQTQMFAAFHVIRAEQLLSGMPVK